MQKFINPGGLIATFDGAAIRELGGPNPTSHKLPVKLHLRGDPGGVDPAGVDAFNALDFFILSEPLCDHIDQVTGRAWPRRRAVVFRDGTQLPKRYHALIIDQLREIGVLKATEADWMPDANYPVRPDGLGEEAIALDRELKFPVVADSLLASIEEAGFKISSRPYPVG